MGEYILLSTPQAMNYQYYTFDRAEQRDIGWVLILSKQFMQGYGGGGSTLEYPVVVNESIPFAGNMKAFIKDSMKPEKPVPMF